MNEVTMALRLLLALLYGAMIGIERQWHHKNAGIKTNTLVAVGAAAFAMIAELGFGSLASAAQVAAGVVTGIGFIGGGVIMRRGGSVQGINSAATLWATASIGLASGGGHYTLATMIFSAIIVVQFGLRRVAVWIDRRAPKEMLMADYDLTVSCTAALAERVGGEVAAMPCHTIERQAMERTADGIRWTATLQLSGDPRDAMNALEQRLFAQEGVARVEWVKAAEHDDHDSR